GIRDKLVTGVQTCALPILQLGQPFQRRQALDLGVAEIELLQGDEAGERREALDLGVAQIELLQSGETLERFEILDLRVAQIEVRSEERRVGKEWRSGGCRA